MRILQSWTLFISGFFTLMTPSLAYNILFALPFGGKSHKISLDPIAQELVKRGHEVTFLSVTETIPNSPGITNIVLKGAKKTAEAGMVSFFEGKPVDVSYQNNFIKRLTELTDATYREPVILDILRHPRNEQGKPRYDLLVVDAFFNEFTLPLAQRMGIPAVYVSPAGLLSTIAWSLNIPHPPSYIPTIGLSEGAQSMNFWGRLYNACFHFGFIVYRQWRLWPAIDKVIHNRYPLARPIAELERKVSLVLVNSHFSFSSQIPTMPYFHEVGGLNLHHSKVLPKDLEDFMQSSDDHGVIYFSLGSVTKGDSMPVDMREKLIKAFARVPQKVLFKFEQNITNENFPKNVKLITWAPQQDILGHPKLRLFITHCGGISTQEAAYHAAPIIGIPLSVDQHSNAGNAVQKGFGVLLDWKTFTVDELVNLINHVIHDKRYKESASKISELMKDRPQPPVETAAYWLEYVIRHKGASHLKSGAEKLNFFQYFLLDVIGAIVFTVFSILWLTAYIVRKVFKLFGNCSNVLCNRLYPRSLTRSSKVINGSKKITKKQK